MSRYLRQIAMLLLLCLLKPYHAQAVCTGGFINPVSDVQWGCVFPITLAGIPMKTSSTTLADPDKVASPVCVCPGAPLPKIGLTFSMWEPSRMIDTVKDPYCLMSVGTKLANPAPGTLTGTSSQTGGSKMTSSQFHYYKFPVWAILGLFGDVPCLDTGGFDVAILSEILPTWQNDLLALIINPEAILFANPAAALACMADAAAATVSMGLNQLFWCMGNWGGTYPLSGVISNDNYVEANAGLAGRAVFFMGRTGLLRDPGINYCSDQLTPIWRKRNYRLQLAQPVRGSCQPIGRPSFTWASRKNPMIKGDNFSWVLFRKNKCCLSFMP